MFNAIIRQLVRNIARAIPLKHSIYILAVLLLFVFGYNKVYAQDLHKYEYKGVYKVQDIFLNYCENCFLQLPPEFLESQIVLSIQTNKDNELIKALQIASRANNWELKRNGTTFTAEPLQSVGNLVYISCETSQPVEVPKYLYHYAIKADSLRCAKNDSLLIYQKSLDQLEKQRLDSLANLPQLDFANYELRYYSFSKSFSDKMGVDWQEILAAGTLRKIPTFYDDWRLFATENTDTTFNFRSLYFSVDSTINVDWGNEEQTLLKTYTTDGIVTQEYEWRKYGMIVTITRTKERVKMHYTFRDKESSIAILQGEAIGTPTDTLFLTGQYNVNRTIINGLPFLSKIPVIGLLFSTENFMTDTRNFNLYLIPRKDEFDNIKKENLK